MLLMRRIIRRMIKQTLLSVGMILVAAAEAMAVEADGFAPKANLETSVNWPAILCTAVFLAAVGVVAFKNARRTHLD